jgi:hypothetical protein
VSDLYGWFDDPNQTVPTHDPPHDAPCPYCGEPIAADDVRTECFTPQFEQKRSYFFRYHRTCADLATQEQRDAITEGVIARIEKEFGSV